MEVQTNGSRLKTNVPKTQKTKLRQKKKKQRELLRAETTCHTSKSSSDRKGRLSTSRAIRLICCELLWNSCKVVQIWPPNETLLPLMLLLMLF